MISSASVSETNPFMLLDQRIQRWIWSQGWTELRAVQELAIPALLAGDGDVLLAAATSAGKTEAAFFPILTRLLHVEADGRNEGGFVFSISPLKALINDQEQRLQDICSHLVSASPGLARRCSVLAQAAFPQESRRSTHHHA